MGGENTHTEPASQREARQSHALAEPARCDDRLDGYQIVLPLRNSATMSDEQLISLVKGQEFRRLGDDDQCVTLFQMMS
jgi:hypothetical protein